MDGFLGVVVVGSLGDSWRMRDGLRYSFWRFLEGLRDETCYDLNCVRNFVICKIFVRIVTFFGTK